MASVSDPVPSSLLHSSKSRSKWHDRNTVHLHGLVQEEAARISGEAAALLEQQAAYATKRTADSAELVRREEAAAAFEASQAQVRRQTAPQTGTKLHY